MNHRLIGELHHRMGCPLRPGRGHHVPVAPDDRDRPGGVTADEEAVVDRVVRDGRGIEARVERQGDLGRLAAGEYEEGERHEQTAHEGAPSASGLYNSGRFQYTTCTVSYAAGTAVPAEPP